MTAKIIQLRPAHHVPTCSDNLPKTKAVLEKWITHYQRIGQFRKDDGQGFHFSAEEETTVEALIDIAQALNADRWGVR